MIQLSIQSFFQTYFPEAHFSQLGWWVAGLITIGGAIIFFLLKHKLKAVLLDNEPRPEIKLIFNGEKLKSIVINVSDNIDIEMTSKSKADETIKELSKQYPLENEDPYKNPWLLLGNKLQSVQNYNNDIKTYINAMYKFHKRSFANDLYSELFTPIQFSIEACGRKTCSNLHISIDYIPSSSKGIYSCDSKKQKEGVKYKEPQMCQDENDNLIHLLLPPDTEKYKFIDWELQDQPSHIETNVDKVIPGVPDENSVAGFLIDTRVEQKIEIKWKVNADDIKETGKTGTLYVNVQKTV